MNLRTIGFSFVAFLVALAPEVHGVNLVNFDDASVGTVPTGWTATQTGKGEAKWAVVQDASAPSKPNALEQSGKATFPVCIKDDTDLRNGYVEVKFKAVSGHEDQAGGLIWRAQDS